jgi:FKBP-type peptidyl-prolyl cis-trans isomerase FkpA
MFAKPIRPVQNTPPRIQVGSVRRFSADGRRDPNHPHSPGANMTRFVQQTLLAAAMAAAFGVASAAGEAAKKPAAAPAAAKEAAPIAIDKNKISTMVGMDIGRGLAQIKDDIDIKVVEQALEQTLKGEKTSLTQEEALQVRQEYMKQMQAKRVAEQKAAAEKNKAEGEAFLAKNKSKAGVKTTASGLQYEVEKEGTGPKPKATDTVKVNYIGTKIDGTKFDSSYDRGQPATFPLNGVIKGWSEGLQLMPVGSKYKLFVPASLAYGENAPGPIGPNATLIFEVELLGIEDTGAKAGAKPGEAKKPAEPAKKDAAAGKK